MRLSLVTHRKVWLVPAGILVLGASVWGVTVWSRGKTTSLPDELSVASLKAQATDPRQVMERVHEAFARNDLTDQQRHELRENVHQVMESWMNERLDEYFTGDEAERQVILDRHIDEMQRRMREWQQHRGEHERPGPPPGAKDRPPPAADAGRGDGMGPPPGGPPPGEPGRFGGGRGRPPGPPTREQRKAHSESRNPDQAARRMAYFTALRKRAEERGIEMPRPMRPPPR